MNHRLSGQELEPFLAHLGSCKDCQEELEFYYVLQLGLNQENDDFSQYNIKKAQTLDLKFSKGKIKARTAFLSFKYAVSTVAFWSIVLCILLQASTLLR